MGKNSSVPTAAEKAKGEFNFVWFFIAAAIGSLAFFSFSRWISAPPEKFTHCRGHLCPKSPPADAVKRNAKGYTVNY